jgi:hypothetical protein
MSEELEDKVRWIEHDVATLRHELDMSAVALGLGSLAPLMSSKAQDWRTPRELFEQIQAIAGPFDLDAAADSSNTLCEMFFSETNRLRDLRKGKFGAYRVLRQNRGGGLWVYRVLPPLPSGQGVLWGHEA